MLSLDPRVGNLAAADVLIEGDLVTEVGPGLRRRDADVVDVADCIVMPGFVDTHRHAWKSLFRNVGDVRPGAETRRHPAVLRPALRPDDVYAATLIGLLGAVEAGITTVVDWSDIHARRPVHRCRPPGPCRLRTADRVRLCLAPMGGAATRGVSPPRCRRRRRRVPDRRPRSPSGPPPRAGRTSTGSPPTSPPPVTAASASTPTPAWRRRTGESSPSSEAGGYSARTSPWSTAPSSMTGTWPRSPTRGRRSR